MRNAWILVALALSAGPATAQTEEPAKPAAEGEKPAAKPAVATAKKLACKEAGVKNGLRGPDLGDHIQVCVEEAKLACLKQAVAQKARGPERKDFMLKCMDSPG